MTQRSAISGEVKIRIISNALSLEQFTADQMRRATGLNPRSLQTVLQRLKREGYLVSEPVEKAPPGSRRPPHVYRLTPDADKRLQLARQVEAFYTPPPRLAPPVPTSRHYTAARHLIERLEREDVAGEEREATGEKIRHHLKLAASEEGLGVRRDTESEILAAHLALLQARLACLQGRREQAEELLTQARNVFASAGLESEVRLIDEHLLDIEASRRIEISRAPDAAAKVRRILQVLEKAEDFSIGPLMRRLTDLARELSITVEQRVAQETLMVETYREVIEVREDIRRLERERPIAPIAPPRVPETMERLRIDVSRSYLATDRWDHTDYPTPWPPRRRTND